MTNHKFQVWVTTLLWLVLACLATFVMVTFTGCGGVTGFDDDALITEEEPEELTELAQEYILDAGDYGFRIDLADSNARCALSSPPNGQVCVVPPNRQVTFMVSDIGISSTQKPEVISLVDGWITRFADDFPLWTFTRVTSGTPDVEFRYGPNSGTNVNSIHSYAHALNSGGSTLDDFGASGTWMKNGTIQCTIDNTSIVNDFLLAEEPRVRSHAVDYCAFKGVGIGSGGGTTRGHAIAVTPGAVKNSSASERVKCLAQNSTITGNSITVLSPGSSVCATKTDN